MTLDSNVSLSLMLVLIRTLIGGFFFFAGSLVVLIVSAFRPFNVRNALAFTSWVPQLTIKALGIKLEIRNHQRFKEYYPCVFLSNHQTIIDLAVHASTVIVPTVAIGKKELKWIPFFGWLFWLSGQILINRKHHRSAMETMKEVAVLQKSKNVAVWFFPEGTRSGKKPMQKFKKGAFYLAIQAQIPILPMATSRYESLNLNRWNAGKIIIDVMDPISTKGLTTNDIEPLMEKCWQLMQARIEAVTLEIQASQSR